MEDLGIGPDEIIVQLEGASVQAKVARLSNKQTCNSYEAIFQVPREGFYRLKVTRLRRNYLASREDTGHVPRIDLEVLLDVEVTKPLDSYMPNPCDSTTTGYWV